MDNELHSSRPARHRSLVYTSAGDADNLEQWTRGEAAFDLFATYYGNREPRFVDSVNFWNRSKGSKYENLKRAFERWPEIFRSYDSVFLLDDDIRISTAGINRLFEVRRELGVTVLQPAFDPRGKISHSITRVRPGVRHRMVNFVENGVALFQAERLWEFLDVYDVRLDGFGVDWWYVEHLGLDAPGRAAIVDEVTCSNPHAAVFGGHREIDLNSSHEERVAAWEAVKGERGLRGEGIGTRTYELTRLRGLPRVTSYAKWAGATLIAVPRTLARACVKRMPAVRRVTRRGGRP